MAGKCDVSGDSKSFADSDLGLITSALNSVLLAGTEPLPIPPLISLITAYYLPTNRSFVCRALPAFDTAPPRGYYSRNEVAGVALFRYRSEEAPANAGVLRARLLVADTKNCLIREFRTQTNSYHHFAGAPPYVDETIDAVPEPVPIMDVHFGSVRGLCVDPYRPQRIYVTSHTAVRAVDTDAGTITLIAGSPVPFERNGAYYEGVGTSARFDQLQGIQLVESGRALIVSDSSNHRMRRIDLASRAVTTLVGDGLRMNTDGCGEDASIWSPLWITPVSPLCERDRFRANGNGDGDDGTHLLWISCNCVDSLRQLNVKTRQLTTVSIGKDNTRNPSGICTLPNGRVLFACSMSLELYVFNPSRPGVSTQLAASAVRRGGGGGDDPTKLESLLVSKRAALCVDSDIEHAVYAIDHDAMTIRVVPLPLWVMG